MPRTHALAAARSTTARPAILESLEARARRRIHALDRRAVAHGRGVDRRAHRRAIRRAEGLDASARHAHEDRAREPQARRRACSDEAPVACKHVRKHTPGLSLRSAAQATPPNRSPTHRLAVERMHSWAALRVATKHDAGDRREGAEARQHGPRRPVPSTNICSGHMVVLLVESTRVGNVVRATPPLAMGHCRAAHVAITHAW